MGITYFVMEFYSMLLV
uniref:Uncharacterized protein n=1 Tax=Rhizophora mucronata TaxID=61149 RepID=A0A2P2PF60_RHIMU